MLMPSGQQCVAMESQVAEDITELVRGKSGVGREREVVKPKFGFTVPGADVNVRWLATLVRVEEGPVGSLP
jgi:hypothetical protein